MRTLHLRSLLALAITIPLAFLSSCRKYSGAEEKTDENKYPSVPYTLSITETRGGDTYDWSVSKGGAVTIDGTAADLYVCTDNSVVMYVRGTSSEFSGVNIQIEGGTVNATQLGKTSDNVYGYRLVYVCDGESKISLWNGNKQNKISLNVQTAKKAQDVYDKMYWRGFTVSIKEDIQSELAGYPGDTFDILYEIEGGSPTKSFETSCGDDRFQATNSFYSSTNEGRLRITLPQTGNLSTEVTLKVSDGKDNQVLSFSVKTYRFNVTGDTSILTWEAGSTGILSYSIDTDIPDYKVAVNPAEDAFFSLDGNTITVTEANTTGQNRTSYVEILESSGKMTPGRIYIEQEPMPNSLREDIVIFADRYFKSVMVALADNDRDGEVSFDEAMVPTVLVAKNAGIRDLTGLENFKKLWKVDLQDNDIEDATVLKELPLLYWLDLKGNKNLRTFDVTGCTQYFEHCEFEVTENLVYYSYRYQYGVTRVSDPMMEHLPDIPDTKVTTDWSHHKRMYLVHEHTKTLNSKDMPWITTSSRDYEDQEGMVCSIVFTGMCYLDTDFENGSWYRLMDQARELYCADKYLSQYLDYIDIYYLEWIVDEREKFYFDPNSIYPDTNAEALRRLEKEERKKMKLYAYENLYGDTYRKIFMDSASLPHAPSRKYPAQLLIQIDSSPLLHPIYQSEYIFCWNVYKTPWFKIGAWDFDGRDLQHSHTISTNFQATIRSRNVFNEPHEPTLDEILLFKGMSGSIRCMGDLGEGSKDFLASCGLIDYSDYYEWAKNH